MATKDQYREMARHWAAIANAPLKKQGGSDAWNERQNRLAAARDSIKMHLKATATPREQEPSKWERLLRLASMAAPGGTDEAKMRALSDPITQAAFDTVGRSALVSPLTLAPDVLGMAEEMGMPLPKQMQGISGEPIRRAIGVKGGDPFTVVGEFLDPTAAIGKGLKTGMAAMKYAGPVVPFTRATKGRVNRLQTKRDKLQRLFDNDAVIIQNETVFINKAESVQQSVRNAFKTQHGVQWELMDKIYPPTKDGGFDETMVRFMAMSGVFPGKKRITPDAAVDRIKHYKKVYQRLTDDINKHNDIRSEALTRQAGTEQEMIRVDKELESIDFFDEIKTILKPKGSPEVD